MKMLSECRIWLGARQCDGLPFNLHVLLCPKTRDPSLTQQGQHRLLSLFFFLPPPPLASEPPTLPLCHPSRLRCAGDVMLQTTRLRAAGKSGRGFPQPRLAALGSLWQHRHAAPRGNKCLGVKGTSQGLGEEKLGVT